MYGSWIETSLGSELEKQTNSLTSISDNIGSGTFTASIHLQRSSFDQSSKFWADDITLKQIKNIDKNIFFINVIISLNFIYKMKIKSNFYKGKILKF